MAATLTPTSRLEKPSGAIGWLKVGLAAAGAVGGAGVIAITLHVVTSRSDELPSVADWRRAVVAAAVSVRSWSAKTAAETQVDQQSRQDGGAVSTAQASTEATAMPSQEPDVQYTAKNPAAPAATTVVIEAVERGDAMALLGDYAAARLLYRFAAERGSADAALKLAKTYDTAFLAKNLGSMPDSAEAARWYRAANELQSGIQADQAGIEAE